ncbi:uncharacterized protein K452DRAFT_222379 [Aplosporella prunicola CBS 121167]|uniref:Ketoreductase domain-containing protein n=1 Tax=Aplosporella prunicola CBS 121167 TaxID=1176127 RepID=A0A6A6BN10_9PEZI|nr:uncharacterized protein K452DRAFT_222379 [Aplosporella prunicola CBS 121167]KAF2144645.1 hypothetical protein K452DRAFT_222379 [Aplosporella prunicola CBS 121167]
MSSQDSSLAGKVAIVTGASRGIGAVIALELAGRGAKVALVYVSPNSEKLVDEVIAKIAKLGNGSSAVKIQADQRQIEAPKKIVSETIAAFGDSIDILVNNAGAELFKSLPDITPEDFASVLDLNLRAALFLCQAVVPHLRAPGRIVNVSSTTTRRSYATLSVYSAAKAGLEAMSRSLSYELGPAGHTINVVQPGPVQTEMMRDVPDDWVKEMKQNTPCENRLGTPEDIARVVAFLAGPDSRWITGQCISASGGYVML